MKEVIYNFFRSIILKFSSFFKRLAVKRRLMRKWFRVVPKMIQWCNSYHKVPNFIDCHLFSELEEYFSKDEMI